MAYNNEQISIFQILYDYFKFTKKVREIETFAGYGSQRMAFKRLNKEGLLKSESWKICEWEYHAIRSYYAVHCSDDEKDYSKEMDRNELLSFFLNSGISANGKTPMSPTQIKRKSEEWMREIYNKIQATKNLVDITKVHAKDLEITDKDTYQYILTYSFPCQDLSKAGSRKGMKKGSGTRSGMLWEIERILGECYKENQMPDILIMENVPDVIGKKNYDDFMKWYAVLESLGYQSYYKILNAKDFGIPQNRNRCFMISVLGDYNYKFPKPFKLNMKLRDVLEKNVDKKYYLSEKQFKFFINNSEKCKSNGNGHGFLIKEATKTGFAVAIEGDYINISYPSSTSRRGRVGHEVANTLMCNDFNCVVTKGSENKPKITNKISIRKLTPRECGRLMDVSDEDITKMASVNSNSQLYKQFGNSIVVAVIYYIIKEMCGK